MAFGRGIEFHAAVARVVVEARPRLLVMLATGAPTPAAAIC